MSIRLDSDPDPDGDTSLLEIVGEKTLLREVSSIVPKEPNVLEESLSPCKLFPPSADHPAKQSSSSHSVATPASVAEAKNLGVPHTPPHPDISLPLIPHMQSVD